MHEILTLQLGHRANYLANHFWNTQESYFTYPPDPPSLVDHDIHFRTGIGSDGQETFTPRTLIYDLKGGFGTLRQLHGLYDVVANEGDEMGGIWDGRMVVQNQTTIQPSDYQVSLEEGSTPPQLSTETVRYWSDFNRVYYHPRSIVQINDYELGSTLMPFEKWENGEALFAGLDREVDLLDRDIRFFAEECDAMQGIQVFAGADDAWGGFAARYVESLRDDYGKSSIWIWGLEEEENKGQRSQQSIRKVNAARSVYEFSGQASMYIPISIPSTRLPSYVKLDRNSQWHLSALLSTAVESINLPSRLRAIGERRGTLDQFEAALNVNGSQRIAKLQCSLMEPIGECHNSSKPGSKDDRQPHRHVNDMTLDKVRLRSTNEQFDIDFLSMQDQDIAPDVRTSPKKDHTFGQVESYRGGTAMEGSDDDKEGFSRKRRRLAGLPIVERYHSTLRYPLPDSFPSIFAERTDNSKSIAVHTSLSTTSKVAIYVEALQSVVNRTVQLYEREAMSNGLAEISESYEEGWSGGSDDDSDD